jgi:hypothetical protein
MEALQIANYSERIGQPNTSPIRSHGRLSGFRPRPRAPRYSRTEDRVATRREHTRSPSRWSRWRLRRIIRG